MSREFEVILTFAVRSGASDVHLKCDRPPIFRRHGALLTQGPRLDEAMIQRLVEAILKPHQVEHLRVHGEVDASYCHPEIGRFRANVFHQRGTLGAVLRVVKPDVPRIGALQLPPVVERLAAERRGLLLVTGATGSGKSTTMAAIVQHINETRAAHVVTIEDPIEFHFADAKSVVNQREVGADTHGFASALRAALRQDPDVILVGEMRDLPTIETALHAAETGHLVISTLHTIDAVETVNRVVAVFPTEQQRLVRSQLASMLRGVISQRLVPRKDDQGRVPACEVLVSTQLVRDLIEDPDRTPELRDAIAGGGATYGMQTFDQSLMALMRQGLITYEEALAQSTTPSDFALRASGIA
ncbi:MAG: twitching motility protein PilT [Myxococcales bacterium]